MNYAVKEAFYSLQGEGRHAGRPAVFVRFSGCNLGYAVCPWCDTDWVGTDGEHGGRCDANNLADLARSLWPGGGKPWCVLTGGEPALQADTALVAALRLRSFAVAIETNGTVPLKARFDWVTLSPKAGTELVVTACDELKLVHPQPGIDPGDYDTIAAGHRFLQPLDGPDLEATTSACVAYCLAYPRWSLSEQGHKRWGLR